MPMPQDYQLAQQRFDALLRDLGDALRLTTRNQAYTALDALLTVLRRRCPPAAILELAPALPALARAMWARMPNGAPTDQPDAEARALRAAHNFLPSGGLALAADTLRAHCDADLLAEAMASLPPDARRILEGSGGDRGGR